MTTAMMSEIAPMLDHAGFEAIDLVGGAVFDVCVRYLREDPWERMRILSSWVKQTPLIVMTRGQSLFTFEFFPDDIVALTAERIFANGIRYHTPYDALNDIRNMEVPVRAGKKAGLYVDAGVVYTVSPVHTDQYYARKIRELVALGADAIFLKDPSGLLDARARRYAHSSRQDGLRQRCRCNCIRIASPDLAPYVAMQAVKLGVDAVHTATSTLANGASHPATETVHRQRRPPRLLRPALIVKWSSRSRNGCATSPTRRRSRSAHIVEHDAFHYEHQMPGGMISNLKSQLATPGH